MPDPIRQLENTFIITCTLAANLAANSITACTIQMDPTITGVSMLTVPVNEAWLLEDLFVSATNAIDGIAEFKKNLTQSAYRSPNLNGMLITNVSRPIPSPIMYEGASILTVAYTNLTANGTASTSITFMAKFRRFTPY